MKSKLRILMMFLSIIVLILSCKSDDNEEQCISNTTEYVTSVNSPETGTVGETIIIKVDFVVYNGCGGFGKFIETGEGKSINIEIEARYEGCICTQDVPVRTVNYEFTPSRTGEFELNFKSSPTEFITITLDIN